VPTVVWDEHWIGEGPGVAAFGMGTGQVSWTAAYKKLSTESYSLEVDGAELCSLGVATADSG
jgi:hypothetical protein